MPLNRTARPKAEPGGRLDERQVVVPHEVPEQVDFPAVLLGRDLDPADQLDPQAGRLRPASGKAGEGVVVGDRQGRQADRGGGPDDLARRERAVRMGRVDVQVGGASGDRLQVGSASGSGSAIGSAIGGDRSSAGSEAGASSAGAGGGGSVLGSAPWRRSRMPLTSRLELGFVL